MTNSVKFTIASTAGVEDVVLVQDAVNLTTIHATINDSSTVHDITGASASADGTQVRGYTRWWFFVTETVNLAISGNTATLSISNYSNISGTMSATDSAAVVNFIKLCDLPAIA
jgi:hypothetical protein